MGSELKAQNHFLGVASRDPSEDLKANVDGWIWRATSDMSLGKVLALGEHWESVG